MSLEAIASLQKAIKVIKGLLTDPEKNLGRLNKEDKVCAILKLLKIHTISLKILILIFFCKKCIIR